MNVVVNGSGVDLDQRATVVTVLEHLGRDGSARGVAVAVNGEVVPKGEWRTTSLAPGDRIEVLTAVGGG